MNWRAAVAEFIGTFGFLFIGVGSVVASSGNLIAVALAHGLAIAIFASATGPVSGGQLNPAVSWALWLGGKLTLPQAAVNTVAQVVGGIAGVAALQSLVGESLVAVASYGIPAPGQGIDFGKLVGIEAVLTFFLMFVIWGTAVQKDAPKMAALFIGFAVSAGIFVGGMFTGASMNPARYLGPAVAKGDFSFAAAYIAAPILGAAIAALVFKLVLSPEPEEAMT